MLESIYPVEKLYGLCYPKTKKGETGVIRNKDCIGGLKITYDDNITNL